MAKSTCLLALFVAVVVCAEAIRIDPPTVAPKRGKYFPSVKTDDPRCEGQENGLYPIPEDCTRYLKCVDGKGRERKCPLDYKFDSKTRHCLPPSEEVVCGKKTSSGPSDEEPKCPETYGIFPVNSDCHKYMVCSDNRAEIKTCPDGHIYRDSNGGCVPGTECPESPSSEGSVCKKANEKLPDPKNCRIYIKCVNFVPTRKNCPPGMAFDDGKQACTKDQLEKCKNNDILNVGQDYE